MARMSTVVARSPAPANDRYEMPATCPTTRAPIPQPNPRTEITGSIIGATRFIFQTRRCTITFRCQTASASRRLICVAAIAINRLFQVETSSPSASEGKCARFDHSYQLSQRTTSLRSDVVRGLVPLCIRVELFEVQNLIRKIRLHQNIDIEVYISEHAVLEFGWHINIAVIQSKQLIIAQKLKNVVPAAKPIIFERARSAKDTSQRFMLDLNFKFRIEHDQRSLLPGEKCIPAAILLSTIFQNPDVDANRQVGLRQLLALLVIVNKLKKNILEI